MQQASPAGQNLNAVNVFGKLLDFYRCLCFVRIGGNAFKLSLAAQSGVDFKISIKINQIRLRKT